jgi:hypothetical protein
MRNTQTQPDMGAHMRASHSSLEPGDARGSFGILANLAGAALSVALIAGIGIWGYRLMVRDVTGIPIVRAAKGDMRVLPDDPGGDFAQHQGLAVNAIAAEGAAEGPVDEVTLAPAPVALKPEDAPPAVEQPAPLGPAEAFLDQAVERSGTPLAPVTADATADVINNLVAELAADPSSGSATSSADATPAVDVRVNRIAIDAAGPRQSIRPKLRPDRPQLVHQAAYTPRAEIDPDAIPSGTRLAQLGAFDSAEIARSEWEALEARFGPILADKSRVVQMVESSGRTFYRLRAMGFRDLNDARRFCSAFQAEGVDCIPVAAR